MARPIVLLTDYGGDEFYAGVTRAVLAASSPSSLVVDLYHDIPAHDIARASFILARSFEYLPPDAVVVVVIDPGVGTSRRAVVIECHGRTLIGPDNGFASDLLATNPEVSFFLLDEAAAQRETGRTVRGTTFHGRDLFAPVAAAIARGAHRSNFATPCEAVIVLHDVPSVSVDGGRVRGRGRHIDRFGNVLSDIPRTVLERVFGDVKRLRVRVDGIDAGVLAQSYADGAAGRVMVLINGWDLLEAAVNQGRATDVLHAARPELVRFEAFAD
ncbi:MAG TPA: SAM-dependent chlorinase/fluorinase [Candidatus Krumholzibacteria bacterium]|nr:SAM-dependent chlorinase/fluorinase [Candidatus Krumholzibacteria bacterium]